ncbi:hypothetical protein RSOLAG22IIIB_06726 [Rhizoctonia solani]|uniref:Uncharacterized protein n=1 Tax=Rhizoctonia solani TaxID=456999 RepID=A0A0K6GH47_9AGAM|nr:hypothetical protein RSOLAG22IIIB_06726 [Rhizoctonia solani]
MESWGQPRSDETRQIGVRAFRQRSHWSGINHRCTRGLPAQRAESYVSHTPIGSIARWFDGAAAEEAVENRSANRSAEEDTGSTPPGSSHSGRSAAHVPDLGYKTYGVQSDNAHPTLSIMQLTQSNEAQAPSEVDHTHPHPHPHPHHHRMHHHPRHPRRHPGAPGPDHAGEHGPSDGHHAPHFGRHRHHGPGHHHGEHPPHFHHHHPHPHHPPPPPPFEGMVPGSPWHRPGPPRGHHDHMRGGMHHWGPGMHFGHHGGRGGHFGMPHGPRGRGMHMHCRGGADCPHTSEGEENGPASDEKVASE